GGDRLALVTLLGGAVRRAHAHAAEADRRHLEALPAELSFLETHHLTWLASPFWHGAERAGRPAAYLLSRARMFPSGSFSHAARMSPATCTSPSWVMPGRSYRSSLTPLAFKACTILSRLSPTSQVAAVAWLVPAYFDS